MLQNSTELLKTARREKRCLAAFNVYNMETIQAAFSASAATRAPIILAFGESYLPYTSFDMVAAMVRALDRNHPFPAVLHLDHCRTPDHIKAAIAAGFTSVMYDGSALPFQQNVSNTASMAQYAHERNVSIEGELGKLNPEDGAETGGGLSGDEYTDPAQALEYVRRTGIDALAVSVGNVHGLYHGKPHLSQDRIREIYKMTQLPLVLHGCSGIPPAQLQEAVRNAVAKININTDLALAGTCAVAEVLAHENYRYCRMEKLTSAAQKRITLTMEEAIRLTYPCGSREE